MEPAPSQSSRGAALNTGLGFAAVALWSTTIALGRSLTEQLGVYAAGALIYGLAGLLGCVVQSVRGELRGTIGALSPAFVLRSGALFVLYELCLYLALGLSANRAQVVEVALVHYLWPMLTLFLTVLVRRLRAGPAFWAGALLAMGGVVLAMSQDARLSWHGFRENLAANAAPYAIALVAAGAWALYSVSSQRWSGEAHGRAVVIWMLLTGIVLGAIGLLYPEARRPGDRVVWELGFMAISANLAYGFWERAMRGGNVVLVVSASYLTPLLSTVVSSLYLRVGGGIRLWLGCTLVVGGAVLCNMALPSAKWRGTESRCRGGAEAA
jgi:drug/metabolite transporter (DMT)-like permease